MSVVVGNITSAQIRDLELDIGLSENGVELVYAVDPFDIMEYCFPLGINPDLGKEQPIDNIGDDQIAYDFFFKELQFSKLLLYDEYKIELLNIRNRILRLASRINAMNNLDERIIMPIINEKDVNKRKGKLAELKNSLSFLISFALFSEESVDRFSKLINGRFIAGADDDKLEGNELLFDAIYRNKPEITHSIENAFFEWLDQNKETLDRHDEQELEQTLNSVHNDISVIINILSANDYLVKTWSKQAQKKYLILLHSSTPFRSESIFKLKTVKERFPVINNIPYNILRLKHQMFFLSLISHQESKQEDLEGIRSFTANAASWNRFVSRMLKSTDNEHTTSLTTISDDVISVFQNARNRAENHFLSSKIHTYKVYRSKIDSCIARLQDGRDEDLSDIIEIYQDCLEKSLRIKPVVETRLALENIRIISSVASETNIQNVLKSILSGKSGSLRVVKGKDMIRGTFHHLPLLLFIDNDDKRAKLRRILQPLTEFCLKPEISRQIGIRDFLSIIGEYRKLDGTDQAPVINLISILLLCLLPQPSDTVRNNDEIALEHAQNLYANYEKCINPEEDSHINYKREYLYLLVWLNRRCKDFSTAIEYAQHGINDYPDDPRFPHGKALVLYAQHLDNPNYRFDSVIELNELINILNTAKKSYENIVANDTVPFAVAAINNTLCHLKSIKNTFEKDDRNLKEARKNINEVKKFLDDRKPYIYKQYPEFYHTESYLELQEAGIYLDKGEISQASEKIDFAQTAIDTAIGFVPGYLLYEHTREEIKDFYLQLKKTAKKQAKKDMLPD